MDHSTSLKKRAILTIAAVMCFIISSVGVQAQTYKSHALVEEFTGQWCGYCPLGAWYMDSLRTYLPNNAIIISWHCNYSMKLGDGTEDLSIQPGLTLGTNFGVSSFPGAILGRYYSGYGFGSVADSRGYQEVQFGPGFGLAHDIATISKAASPIDFRIVNVAFTGSTLDFDLDVTPMPGAVLPTEDTTQYALLAVLTEDKVMATQHDYGLDGNDNPSDIDPFEHNDVARSAVSNVMGDNITLGLGTATSLPIRKHYSAAINSAWTASNIRLKAASLAIMNKKKSTAKHDMVFDANQSLYATTYPAEAPPAEWIVLPQAKTAMSTTTPVSIVWAKGGATSANAKLEYTVDGGVTWTTIVASTIASPYSWDISKLPTVAYNKTAKIRVSDAANGSINGLSDAFQLPGAPAQPHLSITKPTANEVVTGGSNYSIMLNEALLKAPIQFELSLDNGNTWSTIGTLQSEGNSEQWNVENTQATTQAQIRVTDANNLTATSGSFTIQLASTSGSFSGLTLGGIVNNKIDFSSPMHISWSTTGNVGSRVIVEYTLTDKQTWYAMDTVASTVTSVDWTTPSSAFGKHPNCYIQVVGADADKQNIGIMSNPAFSIEGAAGVSTSSANGYSVSNYPNPFNAETSIKFTVPVSTSVTIRIMDNLGREIDHVVTETLEAGEHVIPYHSNLVSGVYTYSLESGSTKIMGKMSIVK